MVGGQVAPTVFIKKWNELTIFDPIEGTLHVWWGQPWAKAKLPLATDEDRVELTPDGKGLTCLFLEAEALFVSVGN